MIIRVLLAVLVFAGFLICGLGIASQKLLWNDELYTQVETIDRLGFRDILTARFPEGNLSPLFYVGQKAVSRITHYRLPVSWKGEFCVYEPRGQKLLRLLPVVCMSLAGAVLFVYLASLYSLLFAGTGLCMMASLFSVWAYMPEARPYSLWFFLCLLQGVFFVAILRRGRGCLSRAWRWLAAVNVLLSLTIFFSAVSLIAVSVVLCLFDRRRYLRWAFLVTAIPLAVSILYYVLAKRTYSTLGMEPASVLAVVKGGWAFVVSGALWARKDLLLTNIPPYCLTYIAGGALLVFTRRFWSGNMAQEPETAVFKGLLTVCGMMLFMSLGMAVWFLGWQAQGNFAVAERYFLFLAPYSLLLIISIAQLLWTAVRKDLLGRQVVASGTLSMVVLTSAWTVVHLMKWGPFWSVWKNILG